MERHEDYQANREALREVTSQSSDRPHEAAMARFVAGLAYEERRHEEQHKTERSHEDDTASGPA